MGDNMESIWGCNGNDNGANMKNMVVVVVVVVGHSNMENILW